MRCVAVGCKTGRKSGLRIHSFPTEPKRRLEWAVKVNIAEGGKLWVPKAGTRYGVCEVLGGFPFPVLCFFIVCVDFSNGMFY